MHSMDIARGEIRVARWRGRKSFGFELWIDRYRFVSRSAIGIASLESRYRVRTVLDDRLWLLNNNFSGRCKIGRNQRDACRND